MPRPRKLTYVTVTEIADKRCVLFQRGEKWQARMRLGPDAGAAEGALRTETTKTSDLGEARQKAIELYYQFQGEMSVGGSPRKKTFRRLAEEFLEYEKKHGRSVHMLRSWRMKIKVLNLSFGSMKPAMIDEDRWLTHIRHRITNCKGLHDQPLSRDTLLVEQQTLSAVLRYAYRKKLITGIPELRLPPEAPEPRVRPFFTATERQMLIHKLEQRVADAPNRIIRYARQLLLHYIAILFMTGMRTNDALLLRWKDIVHEVTPGGLRIAKLYLRGKGKPRISLALPDAVKWINKWSEITKYKDDNDLVFTRGRKLPWNGRRGLRAVLEEMKMVNDNFDRPRTPYSLRHTFAMLLLRHPECRVDILAKIMGTSVKMIEKHYGNHASFDNDAALLHRIHEPDPLIDPQVMARLRAEADELFDRQEEVLAGIALAADTDDDEEQEEILRPSVPAVTPKWRLRVGRRSERRPPALPMIIDTAPAAGSPIEIIPPHADPETLLRLAERHFAAIQTIMDALAATENPDLSGVQCLMALRQRGLELARR